MGGGEDGGDMIGSLRWGVRVGVVECGRSVLDLRWVGGVGEVDVFIDGWGEVSVDVLRLVCNLVELGVWRLKVGDLFMDGFK